MKKRLFAGCLTMVAACMVVAGATAPVYAEGEEALAESQALFDEAMGERKDGRLYDALEDFHNILSNQPQLQRARLELAVTYYKLYNFKKAEEQAQQVFDDPKTPPEVKATILAFLAQIRKDEEKLKAKHTWTPTASIGWMHDTNVNVGPGNEIIDIGSGTLYLSPGSGETSDSAMIYNAGLSHLYQSARKFRVGQAATHFLWQSNANYYRRDYFSENSFDMDVFTVATGPTFIQVGNWRAGCPVQVDYIRLGSSDLAWFSSILPSFNKQFPQVGIDLGISGQFTNRDYAQSIDNDRDSEYWAGKLTGSKVWKSIDVAMTVGITCFKDDADSSRYTNDGRDAFIGATWAPVEGGAIYGRFNEKHVDYDGPEPIFGDRYDREEKITLGVSYNLPQKFLKPYTLRVDFIRTDNNSNAAIYEYDREQVMCSIAGRF